MPHRTTRRPSTLRIDVDSLRAQLVEDRPLKPKAYLSLRHVLGDQILDPLGRLEIEMLVAAGSAQAATVNRIGEHPLARFACRGSVVELRCQLGARLGEVPFVVFGAGIWLHGFSRHDARRSLAADCFASDDASRWTSSQRLSISACRLLSTSGPVFPCATAVMYACKYR